MAGVFLFLISDVPLYLLPIFNFIFEKKINISNSIESLIWGRYCERSLTYINFFLIGLFFLISCIKLLQFLVFIFCKN